MCIARLDFMLRLAWLLYLMVSAEQQYAGTGGY
jgi:hypothetical protein